MKFEIELEATIILSTRAVTGMMVPSRPNYETKDTYGCGDPQETLKWALDPTATIFLIRQ